MSRPRTAAKARKSRPRSTLVEPCYRHIGAHMRMLRERRGWTQDGVAYALGWTRASVSNIEAGKQRVMLHDLPRIARVFGVPAKQFIAPEFR